MKLRINRTRSLLAILEQAGWLAVAKIVQGLAGVLATLAIARSLGPTIFGELSLAIAAASLVAAAATLGLEQIATRELTLDHSHAHRNIMPVLGRMRVIGALIGFGTLFAIAHIPAVGTFGIAGLLLVLCLLPLAQTGDFWEWRLIAIGHSKRIAIIAVILSPIVALARVALALLGAKVYVFAWILVAEWSLRSLLLAFVSRDIRAEGKNENALIQKSASSLLRDSAPLLLSGLAVFIYMRLDQFMIASMLDARHVGLYSAVVMLAEVPLVLPALLLRAALPELTRHSISNPAQYHATLESLMRNGFYTLALIAIVLCTFANVIIRAFYGASFEEASTAFRLMVLAAPFVALGILSSAWLVLQCCTAHALRRTAMGAATNILLNLVFIPRFGIAGAAAATLISQIIATYAADALYSQTLDLFVMKSRAMLPRIRGA